MDVSVVIPARNRAHTLPACLASVQAQTRPAREVIVVDDGSSDDTAAVAERHGARVLRGPARGAQAARNAGVQAARGDWIAFQDSDDTWLPGKLALQHAAWQAAGGGDRVVHGDGWKLDEATGRRAPLQVPLTEGDCLALLLARPAPLFPTLLVPRAALQAIGGLDETCPAYQEWDSAIRLARHCPFVHVRQALFTWHWHPHEAISKAPRRALQGWQHVTTAHRADILAHHGERGLRRLQLEAAAIALQARLWDEALALAEGHRHPAWTLVRTLARLHAGPRGVGRLLRLAA